MSILKYKKKLKHDLIYKKRLDSSINSSALFIHKFAILSVIPSTAS